LIIAGTLRKNTDRTGTTRTLIVSEGKEILKSSARLSDLIRRKQRLETGNVSLGTYMYAKQALMAGIIFRFASAYPKVRLDLTSSTWSARQTMKSQIHYSSIVILPPTGLHRRSPPSSFDTNCKHYF
jgi:hypothetical protein